MRDDHQTMTKEFLEDMTAQEIAKAHAEIRSAVLKEAEDAIIVMVATCCSMIQHMPPVLRVGLREKMIQHARQITIGDESPS